MNDNGMAYICGPLTELSEEQRDLAKEFYEKIADVCEQVLGKRAFVPHEHYDPKKHIHFTSSQVDEAERRQICERTSVLIVVAIAPSWGGGIEVEIANQNEIPVILVYEFKKMRERKISRLLIGNPAIIAGISYEDEKEALTRLRVMLTKKM